jgi:hypothetical protein
MEFMALVRLMVTTRMAGEGYERRKLGVGGGGEARGSIGNDIFIYWVGR